MLRFIFTRYCLIALILYGLSSGELIAQTSFMPLAKLDSLSINNINTTVSSTGCHFMNNIYDNSTNCCKARFEVPKGSGKNTIFANAFWIGGYDSTNTLFTAAQTYMQYNNDLVTGPITTQPVNYQLQDSIWNRTWHLTSEQIETHRLNFGFLGYTPPEAILTWPAHGDTTKGEAFYLAPFVDTDNDGVYRPLIGDYPLIQGDESVYMINNDFVIHRETQSEPLNIEIHTEMFAFKCPSDYNADNTIFSRFTVFNRSQKDYHGMYMGLFTDFDLGYAFDDYVGCDTLLSTYYCYNGDPNDNLPVGYGELPPTQSVTFLNKPLTNFMYYKNDFGRRGNPVEKADYYGYLTSRFKDGVKVKYNEHDTTVAHPETNFMYSGNPLTDNGWTQSDDEAPFDRRGVGATGPYKLDRNGRLTLDVAYTFYRSETNLDPTRAGNLQSVIKMQRDLPLLREWYQSGVNPCGKTITTTSPTIDLQPLRFTISPNPATRQSSLAFNLPPTKPFRLQLFDVAGRLLLDEMRQPDQLQIELSDRPVGLYFVKITAEGHTATNKLIKQ